MTDTRQALAALVALYQKGQHGTPINEASGEDSTKEESAAWGAAIAAIAAQPVAGAVATDETGWLIEHSGEILPGAEQRAQVSWLRVQMKFNGYGAREFGFTHDANEALRFARKEDAEAVLAMHLGASPPDWYSKPFSVTEHMWPAASQAQAAPAPEPSAQAVAYQWATAHSIEMLARSGGLKGPADAWTMLRSAIESALAASPQPAPSAQGEPVERNNPLSALAIRLLVAGGHVTQEKANEAFRIACSCVEEEARRMNVELPWVAAPSTPPHAVVEAVPLNFDQLQSVMSQHFGGRELTDDEADSAEAFARAIERAHGIAPKAAQGEPVAFDRMEVRAIVQQAYLALEELQGPGFLIGGVMHYRIGLILPKLNEAIDALASAPSTPPPAAVEAVPLAIDYEALIAAAFKLHRYRQGTGACIAFKHGAEWMRDQVGITPKAAQPVEGER